MQLTRKNLISLAVRFSALSLLVLFFPSVASAEQHPLTLSSWGTTATSTYFYLDMTDIYASSSAGSGWYAHYGTVKDLTVDYYEYGSLPNSAKCLNFNTGVSSVGINPNDFHASTTWQYDGTGSGFADCSVSGTYRMLVSEVSAGTCANSDDCGFFEYYYNATTQTFTPSGASTYSNDLECTGTDCSYIKFTYPEADQVFASYPVSLTMEYYVNSGDLITGNKDNVKILGNWNSVKRSPSASDVASTTLWGEFEDTSITLLDEIYYSYYDIEAISATGTVYLGATIVEEYTTVATSSCWLFFTCEDEVSRTNIIAYGSSQFAYGSLTQYLEWAQLKVLDSQIAEQNLEDYEKQFAHCFVNIDTGALCARDYLNNLKDTILATPPYGYATRIITILSSTSTPASASVLSLTFPTSSPAHGLALNLPLSDQVSSTIASLNTEYDGLPNAYDKFMEIFNLVMYGALGFWILTQVIGTFGLSINYNKNAGEYAKRGTVVGGINRNSHFQRRRYDDKTLDLR